MTTDGLEIPMYFKTVENYFHEFEVEDDLNPLVPEFFLQFQLKSTVPFLETLGTNGLYMHYNFRHLFHEIASFEVI